MGTRDLLVRPEAGTWTTGGTDVVHTRRCSSLRAQRERSVLDIDTAANRAKAALRFTLSIESIDWYAASKAGRLPTRLGRWWGSLGRAGQDERTSRPPCGLTRPPHHNRRRRKTDGLSYQPSPRTTSKNRHHRAVLVQRGIGTVGPLQPRTGRTMARRRWSQVRDDSNIDRLAVLRTLHVANAGFVP
jgi:hypothetical protein